MADSVLTRFLKAALIDIGGDDSKFLKIEAAAGEVAKRLVKTPTRAFAFALVAFDGDVKDDEPVVVEVIGILSDKWPTHYNTIGGSPIAVVRGIILAGLEEAASKSDPIAATIVYLARNVLPFTPAGQERGLWADLLATLGERVERAAEQAWMTPDEIKVSPTALAIAPVEVPVTYFRLDKVKLAKAFEAAAGPHDEAGTAPENPNPYWPGSNQSWVSGFGGRAADAVATAVDPALKCKVGPIDLAAALGPIADAFNTQITEALQAVASASSGLQRRTALLWWKEALYSPSLQLTYRDITAEEAAATMAFDLVSTCPAATPLSVAYFLKETVASLPAVQDAQPRALIDITKTLAQASATAPLRQAILEFDFTEGRGPVIALLTRSSIEALTDEDFRDRTGVPAATALTPPELAVWIFRELQALRATAPESAQRGRKSRR